MDIKGMGQVSNSVRGWSRGLSWKEGRQFDELTSNGKSEQGVYSTVHAILISSRYLSFSPDSSLLVIMIVIVFLPYPLPLMAPFMSTSTVLHSLHSGLLIFDH
jgi:hypothetical protein